MCEYGVFGATDEECQQSRPDDRMADCRKQDISKHAPYETLLRRPTADPRRNGTIPSLAFCANLGAWGSVWPPCDGVGHFG
jgi:hypothetical protein